MMEVWKIINAVLSGAILLGAVVVVFMTAHTLWTPKNEQSIAKLKRLIIAFSILALLMLVLAIVNMTFRANWSISGSLF